MEFWGVYTGASSLLAKVKRGHPVSIVLLICLCPSFCGNAWYNFFFFYGWLPRFCNTDSYLMFFYRTVIVVAKVFWVVARCLF